MARLSVCLLGSFSVRLDETPIAGLDGMKVQELFSFLLLYRDRPHPREALAGILWGDTLTSQSRKYLRQALWRLQCALESAIVPDEGPLLLIDPDMVMVNQGVEFSLDVAQFERACSLAQEVQGEQLESSVAAVIEDAVRHYHGDLLEGWYQDWCLQERERLQNLYLASIFKLMGFCEAHQRYEAGLDYGDRILRYDHAHERTHQAMMRLHYLAGDRTTALRQFDRCVAALDEELGVEPARRTRDLYQQIRADRLDSGSESATISSAGESALLTDMFHQLRQLQAILADIQLQLRHDQPTANDRI